MDTGNQRTNDNHQSESNQLEQIRIEGGGSYRKPQYSGDSQAQAHLAEPAETSEYDTEFASEPAVNGGAGSTGLDGRSDHHMERMYHANSADARKSAIPAGRTLGWVGMLLAIASLFIWPSLFGPAAAIVGFLAFMRGSKALGLWSIVLGTISFLAYIALLPYYS